MPDFDKRTDPALDKPIDGAVGDKGARHDGQATGDEPSDGRFALVNEDVAVDLLTGNQYMPMR